MEKVVTVEKIVHGGHGLSRTTEGVVFVSGALPGETVRAELDFAKGGQPHASCVDVLIPSPSRREPACPLAGTCGGCDWLHLTYDAQLVLKKDIFIDCLTRIGKLRRLPEIVTHASPEYGYRRRVQIKLDQAHRVAGFFKKRSTDVVPVTRCPLLTDPLNALLGSLNSCPKNIPAGLAQLRAISGSENVPLMHNEDCGAVASAPVLTGITAKICMIEVEDRRFMVHGGDFFQSNANLCGKLGLCALEWVKGRTFWDLYGGTGFFSAFVAPRFKSGVMIDNDQSHVNAAIANLAANGITDVLPTTMSTIEFLRNSVRREKSADCVILDPPRHGLEKIERQTLGKIGPPKILSVSCDPATQARDAGFFVSSCGYSIQKASLFDFYPQTHHMETMLLLSR